MRKSIVADFAARNVTTAWAQLPTLRLSGRATGSGAPCLACCAMRVGRIEPPRRLAASCQHGFHTREAQRVGRRVAKRMEFVWGLDLEEDVLLARRQRRARGGGLAREQFVGRCRCPPGRDGEVGQQQDKQYQRPLAQAPYEPGACTGSWSCSCAVIGAHGLRGLESPPYGQGSGSFASKKYGRAAGRLRAKVRAKPRSVCKQNPDQRRTSSSAGFSP